jgi:mono/diheme cytochrome c family protein
MIKYLLGVIVIVGISSGAALAQARIEKGPIKPTPASDAGQMFNTYCAVCHGKEGRGDGPAAIALSKAPADLTRIAARNGGTFPDVRVRRYIEGADEVPAHGTRDMPMWGNLFRSLNPDSAAIRVAALAEYIKKMQ